MSRYAGTTELRQYLASNGALGTTENALLQQSLNRAESAIDDYTRRNFAGTAGTYYVNRFGAGDVRGQALYLDIDMHTLVGVQNGDGQTIPIGSCWLEPRNDGPPYRVVRLKSPYVWVWNTDSDLILSGTFGFGTVPPDAIVQATIRYAAKLYREKDVGWGVPEVTGFEQSGEVPAQQGMPTDVRFLLAPYRSRTGGAV